MELESKWSVKQKKWKKKYTYSVHMQRTLTCMRTRRCSRGCVCLHMNALACLRTCQRGWDVCLLADVLTWSGTCLPARERAGVVGDAFARTRMCWPACGRTGVTGDVCLRADVLRWPKTRLLDTDALAGLQTCRRG